MSGTGDTSRASYLELSFSPAHEVTFTFDSLKAHEELGRPFLFDVMMSSGKADADVSKLVAAGLTLKLQKGEEEQKDRYFHGIVTRVVALGLTGGAYRYRLEVRPSIWLLTRQVDCRIFQKKSAFDIITSIFRDAGFPFKDERRSSSGSVQLEYCVQYRESHFDFVQRLMEQFGIYYFFEFDNNLHTLVLADDPNSHQELPDKIKYIMDQTEQRTVADHVWNLTSDLGFQSGKFTFQDYNFTTPSADLTSKAVKPATHNKGDLEVFEYPGPYDVAANGQKLADVRMQAIAADRRVFGCASNSRKLRAGWKFRTDEHPDRAMNRDYLVTKSEVGMGIAEARSNEEGERIDTYHVSVAAVAGDVPFRLHRLTPRPMIRGPQTARVVGPSGDEIYTDEYGRIKVKFHWDRSGTSDEERTCWIRVAQSWAGSNWGSIYIPRVGQEVVVEFLEGNPDRPLVTGVVYNANMKVPYTLPANKTQTGVKTNTSTGGGGSNEFRFEDKSGSEEVYFHAQKDYNKVVKNNETHKVEEGNRSITVSQGNDSKTVSSGNHSIDVSSGKSEVSAAQSIELKVGGNTIKIDTSSITITVGGTSIKLTASSVETQAPMVKAQASATMDLNGGGSMSLKAGMISIN